jgi:hypothetical protein
MEENVPWHHEVRAFAQAISDRTNGKQASKQARRERGRKGERE